MNFDNKTFKQRNLASVVAKGLSPGYGTCGRCELPWNTISSHSTNFSSSSGCFPLCEPCWQELETPEARLPFYRDLWMSWRQWGRPYEDFDKIKTAVMDGK